MKPFPRTTVIVLVACCASALGEIRAVGGPRKGPAGPGMVNLPYSSSDKLGNQWLIYQGGWLQQRGNMPIYGQTAIVQINGQQVGSNNNTARVDEKTAELIFDALITNGPVTMTRRVSVKGDEGYVRYIDVLRNTQAQDQTVNILLQSNLNYGVNAAQTVPDPRGKDRQIAW
ncbi:MAG: hypothetical protein ACREJC_21510, partial [Tepidisphaeraceae bacterium]